MFIEVKTKDYLHMAGLSSETGGLALSCCGIIQPCLHQAPKSQISEILCHYLASAGHLKPPWLSLVHGKA